MKRKVLVIIVLVLASVGCLAQTLPTLTPEPSQTPTILPTLTPEPLAKEPQTQRIIKCAYVIASSLHLRASNSEHALIMGWFTQSEELTVRWYRGDWTVVNGHGTDIYGHKNVRMTGYVKSDWIQEVPCVQSKTLSKRR